MNFDIFLFSSVHHHHRSSSSTYVKATRYQFLTNLLPHFLHRKQSKHASVSTCLTEFSFRKGLHTLSLNHLIITLDPARFNNLKSFMKQEFNQWFRVSWKFLSPHFGKFWVLKWALTCLQNILKILTCMYPFHRHWKSDLMDMLQQFFQIIIYNQWISKSIRK
jgi:hypothetical protein